MTYLKTPRLRRAIMSAVLALTTGCATTSPVNPSAGGGLLGAPPPSSAVDSSAGGGLLGAQPPTWNNSLAPTGEKLIEVRGYVLVRNDRVPANAIGYAVPILTSRQEIDRFCPLFLDRMSFSGALNQGTPMRVDSYGKEVQIAPFVWPVTTWSENDKADCKTLGDRYDISGARTFLKQAQETIAAHGGRDIDALQSGPFILTARRVSGCMVLYDLSQAPDGDYPIWLTRAVEQMSNPAATETLYVTPNWHDKARYYIFGTIPSFIGILNVLMPGFTDAHAKS